MVRKTKEDTEKTYHALLDAAQYLFVKQGVAKTTLNQIAKEAGMTRGALYWHFENKDALILALWEEGAGYLNIEMRHALENMNDNDALERFRNIIQGSLQQILDDPKLSQSLKIIMYCVEITDEKTPLFDYLQEKRKSYLDSMIHAIKHLQALNLVKVDLSADALSIGILSYLYGLVYMHLEPESLSSLEHDGTALIDLYLDSFLVGSIN